MGRGLSRQAGKQASSLQVSLSGPQSQPHRALGTCSQNDCGSLLLAECGTQAVGQVWAPEGVRLVAESQGPQNSEQDQATQAALGISAQTHVQSQHGQ